jgi:replicative DNA helicase
MSHEIASGARKGPENVGRYLAEAAERLQALYRQRVARGTLLSPADRFEADISALYEDLSAPAGEVSSARTGIGRVDYLTGGLEAERLVVVKADTKHGKSQLVRQIALTTAQHFRDDGSGRAVLVFVLEEGERAWVRKAWAWLGQIDSVPLLKRGRWAAYLRQCQDAEQRLNAAQCEWGTLTDTLRYTDKCRDIAQIEATCRALAYERPVGLVVIDYFQLMTGGDPKLSTEEQKLTDRGNRLQMLADELPCPVLCPAQLSHDAANKRTITKGARGIEHNASLVLEWRRGLGETGEMEDWGKLACLLARNGPGFAPVTIHTDRTCGRFRDEYDHASLTAHERAAPEWPGGS